MSTFMNSAPKHIAIIMDGNGRWAEKKGVRTIEGHKAGGRVAEAIALAAKKVGVSYLTLYTFSAENFKRSPLWVAELLKEFTYYLEHKTDIFIEEEIRASFIGDRTLFSKKIQMLMARLEERTKDFKALHVNFAFGYGGRQEILRATKQIAEDVKAGKLKVDQIKADVFDQYLYTTHMPDPDLFIRTSGEMRISNYLLWQMAYTELYFTKTLWPDFTADEFMQILADFGKRERCFGLDRHAA